MDKVAITLVVLLIVTCCFLTLLSAGLIEVIRRYQDQYHEWQQEGASQPQPPRVTSGL